MNRKRLVITLLCLALLLSQGPGHITYAQGGKQSDNDLVMSEGDRVALYPRFDMLVVGVPYEDIGSVQSAGIVQIFQSSPQRLILEGPYWDQGVGNEPGDQFGKAIASGDFNGDGYSDLAVGAPYEDVGAMTDRGVVTVFYGGIGLLEDSEFVVPPPPYLLANDWYYGATLAVGDFDGDGYDDLAVGAPGLTVNDQKGAGGVYVYCGGPQGLESAGQLWTQDSPSIRGMVEADDRFGSALAAGDFDGDGYDDLAIGVPLEDIEDQVDAGAVNVLFGGRNGLQAVGNELLFQGYGGLPDSPEEDDQFGRALAVGDFNNDGYDDLAIGSPTEDIIALSPLPHLIEDLGGVIVILGDASGLVNNTNYAITHLAFEEELPSEEGDAFGSALAAGDINGDGYDDLAIGIWAKDIEGKQDAGAVVVLFGDVQGVQSASPYQYLHQDAAPFIESIVEPGDRFGFALTMGDFNGDGREDLAVGVPGEDYIPEGESEGVISAGVVQVFFDLGSGRLQSDQLFGQDLPRSVEGMAESGDQFGYSLTTMRGPTLYLPLALH